MGSPSQAKVEMKEVKEKQALARSQLLRGAFGYLTEPAFRQRKAYLAAKVCPRSELARSRLIVHNEHLRLCCTRRHSMQTQVGGRGGRMQSGATGVA